MFGNDACRAEESLNEKFVKPAAAASIIRAGEVIVTCALLRWGTISRSVIFVYYCNFAGFPSTYGHYLFTKYLPNEPRILAIYLI